MTFRGTKRLNWRSVEQYLTSKIQRVISEPSLEQKQPTRLEALEPRTLFTAVTAVDLFYNDSAYDDNNAAITVEDFDAVATDKTALKELDQAGFENYSNYHKGINGVMVEIGKRPPWANDPTADDFIFRTATAGDTDGDPFQWDLAAAPTGFEFIPSGIGDGTGTVVMTWDDASAVKNGWLQITVLPTENTQLRQRETFYFGSAVGETGDTEGSTRVNGSDYVLARRNLHSLLDPAPIDDVYDINRDRKVDGLDLSLIRRGFTNFQTDLDLINAPVNAATHLSAQVFSASEVFLRWHDQSNVETGYLITGYDSQGRVIYNSTAVENATGYLVEGLGAGSDYSFTVNAIAPEGSDLTLSVDAASVSFSTPELLTNGGTGEKWYVVDLEKNAPTRGEAGYGRSGGISLDPSLPASSLVRAASAEVAALKAMTGTVTVIDYYTGLTQDFNIETDGGYTAGIKSDLAATHTDFNSGAINATNDQMLITLEDTYGFEAGTYADDDYDDWYWKVDVEELVVDIEWGDASTFTNTANYFLVEVSHSEVASLITFGSTDTSVIRFDNAASTYTMQSENEQILYEGGGTVGEASVGWYIDETSSSSSSVETLTSEFDDILNNAEQFTTVDIFESTTDLSANLLALPFKVNSGVLKTSLSAEYLDIVNDPTSSAEEVAAAQSQLDFLNTEEGATTVNTAADKLTEFGTKLIIDPLLSAPYQDLSSFDLRDLGFAAPPAQLGGVLEGWSYDVQVNVNLANLVEALDEGDFYENADSYVESLKFVLNHKPQGPGDEGMAVNLNTTFVPGTNSLTFGANWAFKNFENQSLNFGLNYSIPSIDDDIFENDQLTLFFSWTGTY